jgi:hypothetical protein
MSKRDLVNPSDALETTAELPSGANNIKEKSMSPLDLLKINVNDHTEKKNGLTYLSWAWAWAEALKADPKATFKVEMQEHGGPLMPINGTFMVWVTVTMFDKPMTCMLPVLDYRNKPIPTPNSFDVNTSIMRCLVKAIAMHGLGLYIYAGEDTPPDEVKDEPEVKVIKVETPTATAEVEVNTANMKLFADSMIQFVEICENEDALKSYWKANHPQLEGLKAFDKTLYTTVLARFTEAKANFKKD